MHIKFSVIIPLYNKESYVLSTLTSILEQTYQDFEIIVVDDASTDNGLEHVKKLNDSRIRILKHQENKGLSETRNTGIAAAKNDYLAFLDADDFWHTNFLESIVLLIQRFPDQKVFGTHYKENFKGRLITPSNKLPKSKKDNFILVSNFFKVNIGRLILTQSCIVVHKQVFDTVGTYDSKITFAEDIDFYIRCFSIFPLAYFYKVCHTQNTTVENSLTQSSTANKHYPELIKYLGQSDDIDRFIYFYLYCFCQRLKLEKQICKMNQLRKKIDLKYLNFNQVVLLYLWHPFYKVVLTLKNTILKMGIQLNSYR